MIKKYIKDMSAEEVTERLQNCEAIRCETNSYTSEIKLINGILVKFDSNGDIFITPNLNIRSSGYNYYFEEIKSFKITETGLYKTRDGRKAFISHIYDSSHIYPALGLIDGNMFTGFWKTSGECNSNDPNDNIISKWED